MNIPVKFKQGILIGSFATDPDIYDEGQIYWNTTYKTFRQSNGIVWSDLEPTPAEFISTDPGQTAVLGSDNKIFVFGNNKAITANLTGNTILDLATFYSLEATLTGNTNIIGLAGLPLEGESFTKNGAFTSTTAENLAFPVSWNIYGTFENDGTRNKFSLEVANYAGTGIIVDLILKQPNQKINPATVDMNFVADGDSRILGTGATQTQDLASYIEDETSWQFNSFVMNSFGVGGQNISNMIADASTQIDTLIDPLKYNYVVIWCSVNSILNNGNTALTTFNNIQTYCEDRKTAGWDKVTLILDYYPRLKLDGTYNSVNWTQERIDEQEAYRVLVRNTTVANFDNYIDLTLDPDLGGVEGQTINSYFADSVHLTEIGYERVGDLYISQCLETVFNFAPPIPVDPDLLIISVKTDNSGTSTDFQFTIPTIGTGYNYSVDWGDGNTNTDVTGDITHTYASIGTYEIKISGDFPQFYFNDSGDDRKFLEIKRFGIYGIGSTSQIDAFEGCTNLNITATDTGNFGNVTNLQRTFRFLASSETLPIIDTSSNTNFNATFQGWFSLVTMPLLDTSAVTDNFSLAWFNCVALENFPANYFDNVQTSNFSNAFIGTNLSQTSIDNILVSIDVSKRNDVTFNQSGGSAPSSVGEIAIDNIRAKGGTVVVTGGY